MSGGVSGYASMNAKVRILYAQLLDPGTLAALGEAADLAALLDGLKRTPYAVHLEGLKEREPAKEAIAQALKARLAATYQSILQAATNPAHRIILQLYRRYELNNLKAVLRGLAIGATPGSEAGLWNRVQKLLFPFGPGAVVPAERMIESGGVPAAIELLRGSSYYEVLASALKRYNLEQSLFPLEVALDLHYWRRLWQETLNLQGQDQSHAMRIVGSLLDINNLMWAIRYRVYQQLSEEELINYTLSFGYRLRDQDIRSIAAGGDIGAVVSRLYPGVQDATALLEEPRRGLPLLEAELQRHVIRQCEAAFVGNPFHVGIPLAYLVLLDLELQDLILLVEAKDSRLPAEKYLPFVLRKSIVTG